MMNRNKIKIVALATCTVSIFYFSCGGNDSKEPAKTQNTELPKSMIEEKPVVSDRDAKIAEGKLVYEKTCQVCHQADGKGLPSSFPPIAQSDYLDADINRAIAGVVNGLTGEITVNGQKYNQTMPATTLTDEEVAAAFTFILNSYGNKGGDVNADQVRSQRK
jgi:nitrite reductase (NO-forming)